MYSQTVPEPRSRRWLSLLTVCAGMMMTFLNLTATISALSGIQADLHVSTTTLVWVSSAYALAVASLVLSAGTLGDILGRRAVFVAGVIVMAVGSALAYWSGSAGTLIAAQAVIGAGGALVLPNSLSVVTASFADPRERTEAVSIWAGCSGVGLAIGPVLAGELLNHFSWPSVYLLNVGAGIIVLILTAVFVRESRHPGRALDVPGLVTGTLSVASATYAVIEGASAGYTSGRLIITYAVFAAALASFIVLESRHHDPMVDLRLFRSGSFSGVMVAAIIAMIAFTGIALVSVLYFERVQDQTALNTGWRLMAMFGPYIVVSALASRIVSRLGFKTTLVSGLVIAGAGALLLLRTQAGLSFSPVWPGLAVFGFGAGFLLAPSTAAAVISVPERQAGMASATVNMFRQLGSVLGSSVLGTIATVQFSRKLTGDLTGRGVPAPVARSVHDAATSGHPGGALPAALAGPVTSAVEHAFTDAAHIAFAVAAVALLAATVPVAFAVRQRPVPGPAPVSPMASAVSAVSGGPAVSGRVWSTDGRPLAGAAVTLTSPGGRQAGRGRSGPDGGYRVPVPGPGAYTLIAAAAGHQPAATPVHANGQVAEADLLLAADGGSVGGTARTVAGGVVPDARVTLLGPDGAVAAMARAASDGSYSLENVPEGEYTVIAAGYPPTASTLRVTAGRAHAHDVTLGHPEA